VRRRARLKKISNKHHKTVDNSYKLLYSVYNKGGKPMGIIINNSSMTPIYEQMVGQIKAQIMSGERKEGDMLPSVRALAKDLRVSALTVKKAYDELEREGFVTTVHGKGTFVTSANQEIMLEEKKKEVEADLEGAIRKGRSCGMSDEEITELFQIILEES
jgi:GntR family transcriptional regulator